MITTVKGSLVSTPSSGSLKLCDYPNGFNNKNTVIIGAWYYRNVGDAYEFRNNGHVSLQLDGIYMSITTQIYDPESFAIAMIKV